MIDDDLLRKTEEIISIIIMPRNQYINEAIAFYNKIQQRTILEQKLSVESELVRDESMSVLKDFEEMNDSIDDLEFIN